MVIKNSRCMKATEGGFHARAAILFAEGWWSVGVVWCLLKNAAVENAGPGLVL